MSTLGLVGAITQSTAGQWALILSLIFGGCCSNAWALEMATKENPHAGTLITFAQFLIVTIFGLKNHLIAGAPKPVTQEDVVAQLTLQLLPLRALHPSSRILRVAITGATVDLRDQLAKDLQDCLTRADSDASIIRSSMETSSKVEGKKRSPLARNLASGLYTTRSDSILIIDGKGLLEKELKDEWDYSVSLLSSKSHKSEDLQASMVLDYSVPSAPVILSPRSTISKVLRTRLKPLAIPISRWMIQVVLYWGTSLLNNLALGYEVSLAVHIIFRSGGLCSNMLLGRLMGKRYTLAQVISVLMVTAGVASATLSSMNGSNQSNSANKAPVSTESYAIGIALLTVALFLSSAMGLAQESAYNEYGRGNWQEGLFYLHFLGLPMFAFVGKDLLTEFKIANASPPLTLGPASALANVQPAVNQLLYHPISPATPYIHRYLPSQSLEKLIEQAMTWLSPMPNVTLPSFYIPLLLNIVTQLICVSGVHRLTSRVSSLTVTLVLVVRKAVSLWISVIWIGGGQGNAMLWGGAAAVLFGTVLYSLDGVRQKRAAEAIKKEE